MPVSGLLHGLVTGWANEVDQQRKTQREDEDRQFAQQLQMLEQLRTDPRTTPELYQRVLQDTLKLTQGRTRANRGAKPGAMGALGSVLRGESNVQPFMSQTLQDMADGKLPIFQDKESFDKARSGTYDDLPGGANNPTPPMDHSSTQGGANVAGSVPAVGANPAGPGPTPTPPPPAQNLGAARPPDQGAQPAPSPMPQGPQPTPPGTGGMLDAATGLSQQVAQGGPLRPTLGGPVSPAGSGTAPSPTAGRPFDDIISKTAALFGIRPELAHAVIKHESNYNPNAVSPAGAMGLMQLIPSTAQAMGVGNPMDPLENIRGGLRYLKGLLDKYNGNEAAALAAYNAGPGAMDSGRALQIPETQAYVAKILSDASTVAPQAGAAATPRPTGPNRANSLLRVGGQGQIPAAPSTGDILSAHRGSPSAFFNPNEVAQIGASAQASTIPIQARADYEALVPIVGPELAGLAVAHKIAGFSGGTVTTRQGKVYIDNNTGEMVPSVFKADKYGGNVEIDPRTDEPLGANMKLYVAGDYQAQTDDQGHTRYIKKSAAAAGQPGAVGPDLGAIGKTAPAGPLATVTGAQNQPEVVRVGRSGTEAKPVDVVTPPPPGEGGPPTRRPATRYEPQKPLSDSQQSTLASIGVVERTADRALAVIDQLKKRGFNMTNPIPQTLRLWLYSHGWTQDELEEQLFQNVGANEANAIRNLTGGRTNMRLLDILQQHTGQPGNSLKLLQEKLQGLKKLSGDMRASIGEAAGQYRPRAYDVPGGPQRSDQTAPPAGANTPPPPPRWSNSPQ